MFKRLPFYALVLVALLTVLQHAPMLASASHAGAMGLPVTAEPPTPTPTPASTPVPCLVVGSGENTPCATGEETVGEPKKLGRLYIPALFAH